MNNIPPKISDSSPKQRSIFWKIYFWLLVCIIYLGIKLTFSEENFAVIEVIDIIMSVIATIGLYGYVFSMRIHKQSFWFSFF